jgi:hypothetical protein
MLLVRLSGRAKALGKSDSLAVYLPLLVHTAAVLGLRSGADLIDELLLILGVEFTLPGEAANLPQNKMLEFNNSFVVSDHGIHALSIFVFSR